MATASRQVEEQAGLQTYNHASDAPEVVTQRSTDRRTSQDFPEAVPIEHSANKTVHTYSSDQPERCDSHDGIAPKYEYHENHTAAPEQKKRRRRRRIIMWTVAAMAVLLVVVAAVVGGVLGSAAAKRSTAAETASTITAAAGPSNGTSTTTSRPPESLKVLTNGGMAIVATNAGQNRFAYAQQESGAVIEIPFSNGDWAFDKHMVVTTNANAGASVAATAYTYNGTDYRIVAFVTNEGQVMVTTTTGNGVWSQEIGILTADTSSNSGLALAICADTDILNGIRVYYASSKLKFIREVGLNLSQENAKWTMYTNFTNAAIESGVACSMSNGYSHLYYRNGTQIQQWTWNNKNIDNIWHKGAVSSSQYPAADRSDIAVVTDGVSTDYIFYRLANTSVVRSISSDSANVFGNYTVYLGARQTTEFSATYLESGWSDNTMLVYAPTNDEGLKYAITDSSGNTTSTGLLAYWVSSSITT